MKQHHFKVWKYWNRKIYSETLTESHFVKDGKVHHLEKFWDTDNNIEYEPGTQDCYFVKMVRGKDHYLLPRRFVEQLPVNPVSYKEVKLSRRDTKVYKYIQGVESLNIPANKTMTFREYISKFNPLDHENPKMWLLLKFIAHSTGIKLAVEGEVASGKNSNLTVLRQMRNKIVPKIKKPTRAKFFRILYYNDYINIDEITSWLNSEVTEIEELVVDVADNSPDMEKYSLDSNNMLSNIDLVNKSVTFTFNPVSEFNQNTFFEKFKNGDKIRDRYPVFRVQGKITQAMVEPTNQECKILLEQNFRKMCDLASNESYYRVNRYTELHNYDDGKLELTRRHRSNVKGLVDVIDLYCENQAEFDDWMMFLNSIYVKPGEVEDTRNLDSQQGKLYEEVFIS